MWVLGGGRKHFLEFLRNTSIQFFLMVLVAVSAGKLENLISRQDYKNAVPMGFITLLILLLLWLAAHANIKSFLWSFEMDRLRALSLISIAYLTKTLRQKTD
ncbi:hypothetical protein DB356_19300 [Pseudomonas congelans]|uniref:hypothetical protein n=1 Tax=Pseudomonas congelans TaxID=200452 RepID=UPI001BDD7E49|nr:hypothetical protein [Pseudomonas congelans]QVX16688.1 hypothetical protein DB356_19300 [Pseudomonas congelans]